MCQFGTSDKIIKELELSEAEALIGWRDNIITNSFNDKKEKFLRSLHHNFIYPKNNIQIANPTKENSEGYYTYYNYNYYNNNYNYNYNNIQIKCKIHGRVFEYKDGYRSSLILPIAFVTLDKDSKWFDNKRTLKFANHFNTTIENLAKEYNCETIEFSKRS